MGDALPTPPTKELKLINLLKGWPNPSLLPTKAIAHASQTALSNPDISIPALCYGPDPGYQPLREEIARWLSKFYSTSSSDTSDHDPTLTQPSPKSSPDIINHPPPDPTTKHEIPAKAQVQLGTGESNFIPKEDAAERICITGGASQSLACVLQVYSDPVKTKVWMVAPCYFLACRIFEDAGLTLGAVPEGEDGEVDLAWLERELIGSGEERKALKLPKPWSKFYSNIIYLVPTFSNPSGKTMPLSHRKSLVLLARKHDALIITDDVYDFLQWPTTTHSPSTPNSSTQTAPVPRLVDIDRTLFPTPEANSFGNALSNGSFSKIVGPGVRTGWAEASPKLTYGLSQCGSSRSGGAPSQLVATIISEMLRTNTLQSHIQDVLIPAYQARYGVLIEAVRRVLLPLGVTLVEAEFGEGKVCGGYFVWLSLPRGVGAREVCALAMEEWKLVVSPGYAFEVNGDERVRFENQLRVCFAWEEEADLVEGVERLGKVIKTIAGGGEAGKNEGDVTEKEEWKQDLGEFQ